MPKLREVNSLHAIVFDVFLESVLQCLKRLSDTGDRDLFRSGVIAIREKISFLPGYLLSEFAARFLEEFSLNRYDRLNYQTGLEMIMDIEIVGLRLGGRNSKYLMLREGHRFPRIKELDLTTTADRLLGISSLDLSIYNLNDLTTFVYPDWCRDSDLNIIGEQCPNLEVLRVTNSRHVTDEGLLSLNRCSNLREVDLRRCINLTHRGINHVLIVHEKLEEFRYGSYDCSEAPDSRRNIDASSGLDVSIKVLTLKHLDIESLRMGGGAPLNLRAVVEKFPNLISLKIYCGNVVNLHALKCLDKLTGLEIHFVDGLCREEHQQMWVHLEDIFTSIGTNITHLTLAALDYGFGCQQEQLNMMFNRCPNLEHLQFDYKGGISLVPEFAHLKVLTPRVMQGQRNFELGKMASLEVLTLPDCETNLQIIESIMLDNERFPKLSVLRLTLWTVTDIQREVERIARANNLDFRVEEDYKFFYSTIS